MNEKDKDTPEKRFSATLRRGVRASVTRKDRGWEKHY